MVKLSDDTWQSYRENEATVKNRILRFRSDHPLVSALPYIHSLDIIHQDVRVESILISSERDIKLSNFSLATQLTKKMPVCKTRVGYLSWLAPKVLSGRGYTTACDKWAVASNVIEHADGKPFLYVLTESIVRQHISYSTPPNPVFDIWKVYTGCPLADDITHHQARGSTRFSIQLSVSLIFNLYKVTQKTAQQESEQSSTWLCNF